MNCSTFRKHMNEYLNNELFLEVSEAMDDHLKSCSECRRLHDEELYIDKLFKSALEEENISFRRSRGEIINSIDKKRYSKSPINKLKFSLAKNKVRLSAALLAASFLLFILNSNVLNFSLSIDGSTVSNSSAGANRSEKETSKLADDSINADFKAGSENIDENIIPAASNYEAFIEKLTVYSEPYRSASNEVKFKVQSRAENEPYTNPSSWKVTSDNKYSALLDGKGEMLNKENVIEGVREEGTSVIVVKDNKTKTSVNITLESQNNQYAPLYVEWANDGKLLVIVGSAYGTVVRGGDIYLLDTDTGSSVLVYKADKEIGEEAAVIEVKEEYLAIYLMKYLDNNKTTGTVEEKALMLKEVTEENIHSTDEALINLVSLFNSKEAQKAEESFLMEFESYNLEDIGDINSIENSKLISLRRIDNFYDKIVKTDYGIEDVATYLVEIDYKLLESYDGPLKEGKNYQAVTLVKTSGSEDYKIADIFIVPSS